MTTNNQGTVLITGASKGIGEDCALYLIAKGFTVFAGIRDPKDGERLRAQAGENLIPVRLDVTETSDIQAAVSQIKAHVGERGLAGLVNNAGFALPGPLEFLPLEDIRWQLEVNPFGQIAVTQAMLPLLRKAGGRIVNMSSISGRISSAFVGPYSMSKFALEAFTDSLRRELLPWNMHVASIEPGNIDTPIWKTSRQTIDNIFEKFPPRAAELYGEMMERIGENINRADGRGLPPVVVSEAVHHALTARKPRVRYGVGPGTRRLIFLLRFLPDSLIDWYTRRQLYS